jgi:inosose dehydratase
VTITVGNAPCSWGVEFPDDPRNPPWRRVLDVCHDAGYRDIELGPIGYMPEDSAVLGEALAERELTLIGGVVLS